MERVVIPDTVHTDLYDQLDLILFEALQLSLTSAFRLSHPPASPSPSQEGVVKMRLCAQDDKISL